MTKKKFTMYPCIASTRMVDLLDSGLLKNKDAFVDEFWRFQISQNANVSTNFQNFLLGYGHWLVESVKNDTLKKIRKILKNTSLTDKEQKEFIKNLKEVMEE